MKKITQKLIFLCFIFIVSKVNAQAYSFFVAGHTYGSPSSEDLGLYSEFKKHFDEIKTNNLIKFGVLTGDVVRHPSEEAWDAVDEDIAQLGMPVYIAVGNHDMYDRQLYEDRYGKTFFYFTYNNDLFIILDPNLDHWNISREQIDMINEALGNNPDADNIFVFMHQLLWWSPNNMYKDINVNSTEERADSINFWTDVEPLFRKTEKNIFMFAGDIGATWKSSNIMYDNYLNITLAATGMGNDIDDNFFIVNVDKNKHVSIDIKCIGSDTKICKKDISSFDIYDKTPEGKKIVYLYPNPFHDYFKIQCKDLKKITIYNRTGQVIFTKNINSYSSVIPFSSYPDDLYCIKLETYEDVILLKAIKQ